MNSSQQYDYIITGAGCSGLSLLMHLIRAGCFENKRILLIDKQEKLKNDRTWCFWEKEEGLFEKIVFKKWDHLWFHSDDYSRLLEINPYQYKMIRGVDFYRFCFDSIRSHSNIDVKYGNVNRIISGKDDASVILNDTLYTARYIFNSIIFEKPQLRNNEYYLLQHFKGWEIETETDHFNPGEAVLMDFRISQHQGASFVYLMPFTTRHALIEFTVFSHALLEPHAYEEALKEYINRILQNDKYKVIEEEFGIIPMTNHKFVQNDSHVINIGTAGGQTKASSGYTFRFIQKHSQAIVNNLIKNKTPVIDTRSRRFHFYDSVLLNILHHKILPGKKIFSGIFRKNKPQTILRFLDNESSFSDDLKIISSLPTIPFLKATFHQI